MINIFLWLGIVLLAWLARGHLRFAVGIAVASLPLYLVRTTVFNLPTNWFELVVAAVLFGALTLASWRKRARAALWAVPRPVVGLVGLWLLAALISTAISPELRVSLGILKGWIIVPLIIAGLVLVAGPPAQALMIRALIFSGVITALPGLLQVIRQHGGPAEMAGQLRVASIYDVPNSLALWLAPLTVLALWQQRWWYKAAGLLLGVAVVLTQSVSGLVALCAAMLVGSAVFLSNWQRTRIILTVLLAVLLAAGWLTYTGRVAYLALPWTDGQPNSLSVRLQLWRVSWDLIKDHPLLGVGLGQFEPAYQAKLHQWFAEFHKLSANPSPPPLIRGGESVHPPDKGESGGLSSARQFGGQPAAAPLAEFVFRDPHNWILSIWLNLGLLGLLTFVGIHFYLFRIFYKLSASTADPPNWQARYSLLVTRYEVSAPVLSLLTLLLFGLTDTIYWKNDLAALHGVLIALLLSSLSLSVRESESEVAKATGAL